VTNNPSSPGWYPDPADAQMVRWWDGNTWTEDRQPVSAGSSGFNQYAPPQGAPQYPASQYPPPGGGYGQYPSGPGSGQYPSGGGYGYGRRRGGFGGGYGRPRGPNSFSLTAIAFSAVYVVLAFATGFVLLGIVPVISAVRAFQRGERLAPLAAVAAAAVVAVSVYLLGFHHHT
jgi:hypothetical protein